MPEIVTNLRDYVQRLSALGEVADISAEVDWKLEMGAIIRRRCETGSPAPLFTIVTAAAPGLRALGAPVSLSRQPGLELCRIAVSLGLDPASSAETIVEVLAKARDRVPTLQER